MIIREVIREVKWEVLNSLERKSLLKRPVATRDLSLVKEVARIIEAVREEKDQALFRFTEQFDRVSLDVFKVTAKEVQQAYEATELTTLNAIKEAIRRVSLFHQAQMPRAIDLQTGPGVRCERRYLPIGRVGLYIPGGTAPLLSTVVMLGVPSGIAGCSTRILLTPPQQDQTIDPSLLVTADLLGIHDIYKVGGAQGIAALAYGTESIPKVDKIFGPGNSWVTEAKLQVSRELGGVTCDLPAGPSEVMVIADETADASFVAADLLSQAEHGSDSQVLLISNSQELLGRVREELTVQIERLPRKKTALESLTNSLLIEVAQIEDSIEICNDYAPEHLIVQVRNGQALGARKFAEGVKNAGSVFLGPWTPESRGDYASGTTHVLPTYGYAKTLGGVTTESFMKSMTFQEATLKGLKELGPVVEQLARIEKLEAHGNAVRIRLQRGGA